VGVCKKQMSTNTIKKNSIIYAFIDSQNLNLGIQSLGWKLDFKKFRIYLNDKYHVQKAFLFIGYIEKYKNLYKQLKSYGYTLIFKKTSTKRWGQPKGNVDAELVLFASAIEFNTYDSAILISGDGDFNCLIYFLLSKRKLSRILIPNRRGMSKLLWEFSKYIDYLENLKYKLGK